MIVRLVAIITQVEADILIIDAALAVGDALYTKMHEIHTFLRKKEQYYLLAMIPTKF